jgi:carbon starvation protein
MIGAIGKEQWTVAFVGFIIFSLAMWVLLEAVLVVIKINNERKQNLGKPEIS